jgi:hypothetical protein
VSPQRHSPGAVTAEIVQENETNSLNLSGNKIRYLPNGFELRFSSDDFHAGDQPPQGAQAVNRNECKIGDPTGKQFPNESD